MVADPLAAERAVEAAEETHDETQIKAAKAIRRRTYLFEAALILAAYFVYGWVRGLVEGHTGDAIHRAQQLVRLEHSLHIYHEKAINHFVAQPALAGLHLQLLVRDHALPGDHRGRRLDLLEAPRVGPPAAHRLVLDERRRDLRLRLPAARAAAAAARAAASSTPS